MSDNFTNRSLSGNFQNRSDEPGKPIRYRGPHRLVEECEVIAVSAVQKAFGKKALIMAIRQSQPVRLSIRGGHFDVWTVNENHRLPGRGQRWSSLESGSCRLWLLCPGCSRPARNLYFYYFDRESLARSDLRCRRCHRLVYHSQNCGGNHWYREIARPLKWLLKEKRKVLKKTYTPGIASQLAQIESAICTLRQKVQPKTQRRNSFRKMSRKRRPYRNVALLEESVSGVESN